MFVIFAVVALNTFVAIVPDTVRLVNAPTAVIFGWFAVVSVPLKVLAVILPVTVNPLRPLKFVIVAVVVLIEPAVILPLTVNALKLPRLVILFKVPSLNVPL